MLRVLGMVGLLLVAEAALAEGNAPLAERVLTQEEQQALTPDQVLRLLKEGNQRFVAGTVTSRDHSAQIREAVGEENKRRLTRRCS